jgi:hypothetical protein
MALIYIVTQAFIAVCNAGNNEHCHLGGAYVVNAWIWDEDGMFG